MRCCTAYIKNMHIEMEEETTFGINVMVQEGNTTPRN